MEVKILSLTDDDMLVSWKDETGFGELQISYDSKGRYTIDAEYISMKKLIEIVKTIAIGEVIKLDDEAGNFPSLDDSLAKKMPDYKRKTEQNEGEINSKKD